MLEAGGDGVYGEMFEPPDVYRRPILDPRSRLQDRLCDQGGVSRHYTRGL